MLKAVASMLAKYLALKGTPTFINFFTLLPSLLIVLKGVITEDSLLGLYEEGLINEGKLLGGGMMLGLLYP